MAAVWIIQILVIAPFLVSLVGAQDVAIGSTRGKEIEKGGQTRYRGISSGCVSVVAWQILSSHNELFNARLYCVMKC